MSGRNRLAWRVAVGLSIANAFACDGKSESVTTLVASVYLVNVARESVPLRMYRARGSLDCKVVAADPKTRLSAGSFGLEGCLGLAPFEPLALSQGWVGLNAGTILRRDPRKEPACDAVALRAGGLADTVLFWNGLEQVEAKTSFGWRELDPHAIYLEQAGARLFAAPSELVAAWPADLPLADEPCKAPP